MPKQDQTKFISGKDLGQLAMASFCPRCFWFERHLGKSPAIFPGIFSTLDSLTKRSTKRSFEERGRHPDWLPLTGIKRLVEFHAIKVPTSFGDWILTGTPDEVFELDDGSYHIVDYKTARYTPNQDSLMPMYEVQLNAYAFTLPEQGIKPISKLTLIYCEPSQNLDSDEDFKLSFSTNSHDLKLNLEIIPKLLIKAREIVGQPKPPDPNLDCKGICQWSEKALEKLKNEPAF